MVRLVASLFLGVRNTYRRSQINQKTYLCFSLLLARMAGCLFLYAVYPLADPSTNHTRPTHHLTHADPHAYTL